MSTTEKPVAGAAIHLTPAAVTEVLKFMAAEQITPEVGGLRVSVMPGGCSGFKYNLNIEEKSEADDIILDVGAVKLFVDGFSLPYLNGVKIDYVTSMQGSGFTFENPNATGGCGCGTSFTA
ncbi:MAG: iron-sulfur cluster assembly accessory protein [Gemmatimonadetes bacterium]|nr:iron-sulfur cluster assembly accessory protein [Gemmatimonadota bacterium]